MEGQPCSTDPFQSPCSASVCRSGRCEGEPIREGEACVPTFQQLPPICKQGAGVCVSGVCALLNEPDGKVCDRFTSCSPVTCLAGECTERVFRGEGELCGISLQECRYINTCLASGQCGPTHVSRPLCIEPPSFCGDQTVTCDGNGGCIYSDPPGGGTRSCLSEDTCCPGEVCIPLPSCSSPFGCTRFCQTL
jgi:hypothetical protein